MCRRFFLCLSHLVPDSRCMSSVGANYYNIDGSFGNRCCCFMCKKPHPLRYSMENLYESTVTHVRFRYIRHVFVIQTPIWCCYAAYCTQNTHVIFSVHFPAHPQRPGQYRNSNVFPGPFCTYIVRSKQLPPALKFRLLHARRICYEISAKVSIFPFFTLMQHAISKCYMDSYKRGYIF